MLKKVFINLILIFTVSIQLAHSLQCLTCYDANSCKHPDKVRCDSQSASATRNVIELFYDDIRYLNTNDYSCFVDRYGTKNLTEIDLRGCIMTGTIDCQAHLVGQPKNRLGCSVCKKDLCNSVATISANIGTTIALLAIAKLFVM